MFQEYAKAIAQSPLNDWMIHCLREVYGLPPIIQTIHILSVAIIMATSVMICLRMLGLAVPSQQLDEMMRRLLPWTWCALLALFFSGIVFVIARPMRYFSNPVFGIKLALLIPVVLITWYFYFQNKRGNLLRPKTLIAPGEQMNFTVPVSVKLLAFVSLLLWIGIVLAGRWIAYAEYLFW
ncbi:DUF6644 family protein [Aurantivibrio infirmus]